jgi:hypothetical protein
MSDAIKQYIINNLARDESPLFEGLQHILHLQGSASEFSPTSSSGETDIGYVQNQIASVLSSQGWGVQTLTVTPSWWTWASPTGYNYYNFDIYIDNSTGQDAEYIRANVQALLSNIFSGVTVQNIGENIYQTDPNTGQTVITDQYKDNTPQPQNLSVWEQIFGKGSTAPSLGGATLSFGTIALIVGIGYIVVSSRRK